MYLYPEFGSTAWMMTYCSDIPEPKLFIMISVIAIVILCIALVLISMKNEKMQSFIQKKKMLQEYEEYNNGLQR